MAARGVRDFVPLSSSGGAEIDGSKFQIWSDAVPAAALGLTFDGTAVACEVSTKAPRAIAASWLDRVCFKERPEGPERPGTASRPWKSYHERDKTLVAWQEKGARAGRERTHKATLLSLNFLFLTSTACSPRAHATSFDSTNTN